MDPIDSGKGQGKPSEENQELSRSSKGRQLKRNSKYLIYDTNETPAVDTNETPAVEASQQKKPRKSFGGRAAAAKKSPTKIGKAKNATQQTTTDDNKEVTDKTPQVSDENPPEQTPKKRGRPRKTPSKETPAKKTPATDGDLPAAEGGVVDTVKQENGTPKRKQVRKQHVQEASPVAEPPREQDHGEPPTEPEEEPQPGGRRRRNAAQVALKYLHILAKEVFSHNSDQSGATSETTVTKQRTPRGNKVRKGRKSKRPDFDSDPAEDEDFVPDFEEEEELVEEMDDDDDAEEAEDSVFRRGQRSPAVFSAHRNSTCSGAKTPNRLNINVMKTVWNSTEITKKFREEHYSSWVFPEWVPSTSAWRLVPQSDLEEYLPQELLSAAFRVSREGLCNEETPLQRLSRFGAVPAHPDRWDMVLYAGGPVWAMEWCPTPDGAPATQYIALACHREMDDLHYVNKIYTGPGLVQLWDVGKLEYSCRPESQPSLAYGLAQDKGFIWHLKWCPAGGWELPTCGRKAPFLPRLGLLAVASSTGVVTIYSLPHPDALLSNRKLPDSGSSSLQLPIYKAQGVLTLKLGSFKAPRHEKSGQVLSMDWLPEKPHNIMAIGFYDGVVGLWDLTTKSPLLRVRESDESLSLLPYRCLLAHDHAVRALAFCPASRYLLVTAGEDRYVKTWDLRRLYDPVTVQKRYLTNEIYWPMDAPGLMLAQENAYAAKGTQGVHYFDHYMRSIFMIPRTGTLWSVSYSDWLNSVVTSDVLGEVIFSALPQINYVPPYVKQSIERRFPVYLTSLVPYDTTEEENQEMRGVDKEGEAVGEREGGEKGVSGVGSDGGNEKDNENERGGGRNRSDESLPVPFQTYKEAVKKYSLHHTDNNMSTFAESQKHAVWKRMKDTELKAKLNLDEMPLAALHKVRFNPNMNCHTWVVSGGRTGLVRLNCLKSMISSSAKKMISEHQAQFSTLYSPRDQEEAIQTGTDQL
ncbi:general transcription factor 3C polypeptide 2 isoform X2 [Mastacembelus armatus]|uniref:General transcription factor IIIC, polypeptide 2, beta n=1 Tax=Mastacembelus armatus TaxID=205130 RepID=A0A3Q3MMH0_9TELE|nr:general transcription factor 3C polypeptide 2 isoform X2 [Mastacembelus armatus]